MSKLPSLFGKRVLNASRKHAESCFPNEAVGVVVNGYYKQLTNIHEDPRNHFKVSPIELIATIGEHKAQAIIHSHALTIRDAHLKGPSEADMKTQIHWQIPFGIQLVTQSGAGNIIWWGDGVPVLPYEGRQYVFGVYDCYSIIRDFFKQEFNIYLRDYARADNFWDGANAVDLYLAHIESEGFVRIDDNAPMKRGDVVLIRARSKVVNHCVIYLGGDQCLHHMSNTISKQESINRFIDRDRALFHSIWRHPDVA